MTFDSWQGMLYPEEYLEHHGILGMKHGRRRYQNEDGTWTEAGLEARRKREGFGESRAERKAAKRVAKLERKQARKAARNEAAAARAEKKRLRSMKGLTDDELKARIARLKLENEYKDLKRSPLIETGAKLVGKYLEYKGNKEQRALESNKQKLEMEKLKTQQIQAKSEAEKSKNRIKSSKNEALMAQAKAKEMKENRKAGLKIERKKELKQAKIGLKKTTIRGGIAQKIHDVAVARGEGKAERIKERAFVSGILRGRKRIDKYNNKLDPWQQKLDHDPDAWNRDKNRPRSGNNQPKKPKNKP